MCPWAKFGGALQGSKFVEIETLKYVGKNSELPANRD